MGIVTLLVRKLIELILSFFKNQEVQQALKELLWKFILALAKAIKNIRTTTA
jgi:hypothetical protein